MEKIVGNALRKEREARGVSLAEIAADTRISMRLLQALEDEDFAAFPGAFYVHYYIKDYLHACGADETAFFNTFQPYLNAALRDRSEVPPDQYLQKMAYAKFRRSQKLLLVALLLALLALLAFLLVGPPRLLDRLVRLRPSQKVDVPSFSASLLQPADEHCLDAAPVNATLSFASSCWVRLLRGEEKVAERVYQQGDAVALHGYQLTLVIEKPQALRLQLNGQEVPFLRRSTEAVKLVVDPTTLAEILRR